MSFEIKEDAFAGENFNEKLWLSKILSTHSSDAEQLKLLTIIDSKLQLVHHNCIHSLAFNQKVLATKLEDTMPAASQALSAIEAVSKAHRAKTESKEIARSREAGRALEDMCLVKGRIEKSLESLNSIESFEVKAMEIEGILMKGSLDDLLAHIEGMQNSFVVMRSISTHLPAQKRSFDVLKQKLITFSAPLLEQAIQSGDVSRLAKLARVYEVADHAGTLIERYAKLEESVFMKSFADRLVLAEQSVSKDSWISTFLSALAEYQNGRKAVHAEVMCTSGNLIKFYKALFQTVLSKTQDTLIDKVFSEEVATQPTVYYGCLRELYDLALGLVGEQAGPEFMPILLRPCKEIISSLLERYAGTVTAELKKSLVVKYDDFELKEVRKAVKSVVDKLKLIYTSYRGIAVQYQLATFLSTIKKSLEEYLLAFVAELNGKAAELHGGVSIALIDGQTDREPQGVTGNFDWKKIQIAVIQFDIIQDLVSSLEGLQKFVNEDTQMPQQQEAQLLPYTHYMSYLEQGCSITLFKKSQVAPSLQISEEAKTALSLAAKNILIKCFYSPIFKQVIMLQTNKIWTATDDSDPDLPQFTLTPSEAITSIGEQLIAVIHRLESLNAFIMTSPDKVDRYVSLYKREVRGKTKDATEMREIDVGIYWIVVLGVSVCQVLTGKYMQIHALSEKGRQQLAADVTYILNILKVINVEAAVRSTLESVAVALRVELKGNEPLPEKVAKAIDTSEDLKGISKELLDMTVIKGIMMKRVSGNKTK